MNYYIDIQIRPNSEFEDAILLNEVYFRLHQALVKTSQGAVGISFPKFKKNLGNMLRIHGSAESLSSVMSASWLTGRDDYTIVSNIAQIPATVEYRVVKRVQIKSSPERLLRRSVKKGWLTQEEAELQLSSSKSRTTSLPYINLKSLSTGQRFRLFIEHGPIIAIPQDGEFSAYGLSAEATVPWF